MAGQPGAAVAAGGGGHAQQRRAAGPGRGGVAGAGPARPGPRRRPGGGQHVGPDRRRVRGGGAAPGPGLADERPSRGHERGAAPWWPWRSTSAARTSRTDSACSPTRPKGRRPRCRHWRGPPPAGLPRWAKLSPNVTDLVAIADAALADGATALTLVNTLMGMAIDTSTGLARLGAGGGGLSGPAVHPVAVRAVYECRQRFPAASIIGVGGIVTGRDAAELLWPEPTPYRWARRPSPTPGHPFGCWRSWWRGARRRGSSGWTSCRAAPTG